MTSPTYLLDTGWIIRHLRGVAAYSNRLVVLRPEGLAVSVISVAELFEGVVLARDTKRAEQAVSDFLSEVTILPVSTDVCRAFGVLSASLRGKGQHPGDFDVLIAATAKHHDLTILTTDADDFSRFEELRVITKP